MAKFSDHQAAGHGCNKQEVQCLHSTFKKKKQNQPQQKPQIQIILLHADSNSGLTHPTIIVFQQFCPEL